MIFLIETFRISVYGRCMIFIFKVSQMNDQLKFIYSEKATKFSKISTVDLSYVLPAVLVDYVKFIYSEKAKILCGISTLLLIGTT